VPDEGFHVFGQGAVRHDLGAGAVAVVPAVHRVDRALRHVVDGLCGTKMSTLNPALSYAKRRHLTLPTVFQFSLLPTRLWCITRGDLKGKGKVR